MQKKLVKVNYRLKGFGIIDSVIALSILSSVILGIIYFNKANFQRKQAKELAEQTQTYAQVFTEYMNYNRSTILASITQGPYTLSPQTLGSSWPSNLATENLYGQTPCVGVSANPVTGGVEAIMYYTESPRFVMKISPTITNNASTLLGNKGGVLKNGSIQGNSGWSINNGSAFFAGIQQCSNELSDNSVAVNLDLMSNWNQDLQPATSINKEVDNGNPQDIRTFPGHILNSNTSRANINFANSSGVIFDNSNSNNPIKLSIQDNGITTGSPTLAMGNVITSVNADTIQATQQKKAGDSCQISEIGKTVTDMGSPFPDAAKVLARNTLVCTKNDMLCATSHTCYLPATPNSVIYQNTEQGIQDQNGNFICPAAVPFASNPITGGGGSNGYYYATNAGDKIGCNYAENTDGGCFRPGQSVNICPLPLTYSSGCGGYSGPAVLNFGAQGASGPLNPMKFTNSGGEVQINPLIGHLSSYQTTVGYQINVTPINLNCSSICAQLLPVNSWIQAVARPNFDYTSTFKLNNSCGCWIYSNNMAQALAIAVLQAPQAILKSVTCSNMPIYTSQ